MKMFVFQIPSQILHFRLLCYPSVKKTFRNAVRWISTSSTAQYGSQNLSRTLHAGNNHYEILDVQRSASSEEIRAAFLKLSKQCHPDINSNPDNHKQFVLINEAYSVLSKPLSRRDYDLTLNAQKYMRQQQYSSAYRSHGYGHNDESGHYYHYRSHVYEDGFSSRSNQHEDYNSGKRLHKGIVNFYSITAFITVAICAVILESMYFIYPNVPNKMFVNEKDLVDNHELIMSSEHDGRTVFYYAVPSVKDPQKYEILAVAKKEESDDTNELEQLNIISQNISERYDSSKSS